MADNSTLPATGELIASDELATINGQPATAFLKVQRAKVGFGVDGDFDDVSDASPLPVADDALLSLLKVLIARVQPLSIITGAGSNRLSVDVNNIIGGTTNVGTVGSITAGTLTTVGTVTTVGNQAQMGGVTAFGLMHAASRTAFNTGTRTRL
jgi:hypothetical protein